MSQPRRAYLVEDELVKEQYQSIPLKSISALQKKKMEIGKESYILSPHLLRF